MLAKVINWPKLMANTVTNLSLKRWKQIVYWAEISYCTIFYLQKKKKKPEPTDLTRHFILFSVLTSWTITPIIYFIYLSSFSLYYKNNISMLGYTYICSILFNYGHINVIGILYRYWYLYPLSLIGLWF